MTTDMGERDAKEMDVGRQLRSACRHESIVKNDVSRSSESEQGKTESRNSYRHYMFECS